jgi:transposase
MGRRSFSREFKLEAVRLVRERGVSVAQAARDLDLHQTCYAPASRSSRSGRSS